MFSPSTSTSSKLPLPNVRRLFVPDPGYIIVDADLSGADAQIVAAEANDYPLLKAFSEGLDVHTKNAVDMWGDSFDSLTGSARRERRNRLKIAVHATNYGASARTLTLNPSVAFTLRESEWFQRRWFSLHPGIEGWHRRIERDLQSTRTISNRFGYRIIYFDRIEGLLPQALAWIPQSTVAEVCFRAALQVESNCPWVEMLLQVHDSLVFQIPESYWHTERIVELRSALIVPVPYDPPLVIKWKIAASPLSWGDCKEVT